MFNLKRHAQLDPETDVLRGEMELFGIHCDNGQYRLLVGDELIICPSRSECINNIQSSLQELKKEIFNCWQDLSSVVHVALHNDSVNKGGLENILFLNNVKKSFLFSKQFPSLSDISKSIKLLFDIDASKVNNTVIHKYNCLFLRIKLLHRLILEEMYRTQLLDRWGLFTKQSQVQGPWANLDLPMQERVWSWDDEAEDLDDRDKSRKNQTRYNPETNSLGFYYVWQELAAQPYDFDDMKKDSPYKSRSYITIP